MMRITSTAVLLLICLVLNSGFNGPWQPAHPPLPFDTAPDATARTIRYGSPGDAYLELLRDRFGTDQVVAGKTTDLERAQAISLWVHNRLQHNGGAKMVTTDPMTILKNAVDGDPTQCIGFGIVTAAALQSIGIPARPIYFKAADCATNPKAAGHVATEAWFADLQKWVLVDAQWDIIPTLNNTPLNAVELQRAIAEQNPSLGYLTSTDAKGKYYFYWLHPMLYHFDTPLDNRQGVRTVPGGLMLLPTGAKKPATFQGDKRLVNMFATHSLATFYAGPQQNWQALSLPSSTD